MSDAVEEDEMVDQRHAPYDVNTSQLCDAIIPTHPMGRSYTIALWIWQDELKRGRVEEDRKDERNEFLHYKESFDVTTPTD
jgi:hypothetical protein